MEEAGILTEIEIDHVSLSFVSPIDITTIFGNLLDNTIEAARQVDGDLSLRQEDGRFAAAFFLNMP